MASSSPLPFPSPDSHQLHHQSISLDQPLLDALTDYNASLLSQANKIVSLVKAEHYFDVGLEIVKTIVNLEDNEAEEQSMMQILRIKQSEAHIFREKLVAFLLHGESFLRCVHKDLPPERNPFLWHWMAIVKNYKPDKIGAKAVDTLRDVWHLRYEYVKTILGGTIPEHDSPATFEKAVANGSEWHVTPTDFSKFEKALHDLGISDDEDSDLEEHANTDPTEHEEDYNVSKDSVQASASEASHNNIEQASPQSLDTLLEDLVLQAAKVNVTMAETTAFVEVVTKQPTLVTSSLLETASSSLHYIVHKNPQFAKVALRALLEAPTTTTNLTIDKTQVEEDQGEDARNNLLWSLGRLPADLVSMDLITTLLIPEDQGVSKIVALPLVPDPEVLVHAYLATALRALEEIASISEREHTHSPSELSPFSSNEGTSASISQASAGNQLLATLGGQTGREAQTRVVELLLLFIKNLLHKEIVTMRDLRFEIQEIGVRCIFVPAAREFWQEAQKVLYDPKAKDFDE